MSEQLLTVKEVAAWLAVSERKVNDMARERELPGYKVGKDWRFSREEVRAYLAAQRNRESSGGPTV